MRKFLIPFSYIFHPLFIPLYATFFYVFANHSYQVTQEKAIIALQVLVATVIIPLIVFLLLRSIGKISSVMAPRLAERKIPLVIQCFLLIALVKKGITLELYPEFHFFLLGALFSSLFALILLFAKTKASLHMISISALTIFVFGLNKHFETAGTTSLIILGIMNVLVAASRLEMKAHTRIELIIGFLLGSLPQIALLYLWL